MNSTLDLLWTWGLVLVLIAGWCVFWLFGRHVGRKLENAKAIASTPSEGRSDTLTLMRAVDPTNFLRKFSVFIDDVKVGYIGAGEAMHYPLSQGVHRVAVKVDFCKSRELTIEKLPEKNLLINCGSTYNDWRCLYAFLIKPRDYIYVRTKN
jgi:hypothetical protein